MKCLLTFVRFVPLSSQGAPESQQHSGSQIYKTLLFFWFRFEYLISGRKSYRDFRETGPWTIRSCTSNNSFRNKKQSFCLSTACQELRNEKVNAKLAAFCVTILKKVHYKKSLMAVKNLKGSKLTVDHHSQDFLIPRYKNELGVTAIIKVQDENHIF